MSPPGTSSAPTAWWPSCRPACASSTTTIPTRWSCPSAAVRSQVSPGPWTRRGFDSQLRAPTWRTCRGPGWGLCHLRMCPWRRGCWALGLAPGGRARVRVGQGDQEGQQGALPLVCRISSTAVRQRLGPGGWGSLRAHPQLTSGGGLDLNAPLVSVRRPGGQWLSPRVTDRAEDCSDGSLSPCPSQGLAERMAV